MPVPKTAMTKFPSIPIVYLSYINPIIPTGFHIAQAREIAGLSTNYIISCPCGISATATQFLVIILAPGDFETDLPHAGSSLLREAVAAS
jgi:hypothetical protein